MSTLRAYLGSPGLTDVGYRFYTQNTPVAARQTTGILDEGDGWYSVAGVTLAGDHVRWDAPAIEEPPELAQEEALAREDLALRLAIAALAPSSGSGTGANIVTVTVKDSGDAPLQNAKVRVTEGITSLLATTDASGQVVFNLDPATYRVAITKPGYAFTPDTFDMPDADIEIEFEMDQVVINATGDPALATGFLVTRDAQGAAVAGIKLFFQLRAVAAPIDTDSFKSAPFCVVSGEAGALQLDLVRGATYRARRDYEFNLYDDPPRFSPWVEFTVPTDADNFPLPIILGQT